MDKWYIAGPFFNEPQCALIREIETTFLDTEVPFFSPRLASPENAPGRRLTSDDAAAIFKRNVVNIRDCTHMLAVLDYLQPEGFSFRAVYDGQSEAKPSVSPFEISIPDSGTVFEMGFAYGHIPIYGFTTYCKNENDRPKLNIMLTQACRGVILGALNLHRFLLAAPGSEARETLAPKYSGEHA